MNSVSLPPDTTEQQDMTVAGQRRVNLIWEYTQSFIAIIVVLANMMAAVFNVFHERDTVDVPMILSSALFLIVGFYFSRTNHQAIGGIGKKPQSTYEGR